jgi:Putative auto-transporter adhesin, head GIN domain
MSKYIFFVFVLGMFTFALAEDGSGNVVSEERDVSGFTGISLVGIGEVTITQGEQETLTVETDDNLLPLLETTVQDGLLVLTTKDGVEVKPSSEIRFLVTVTSLDRLESSGAGNIEGSGLTLDALSVDISGAGNVTLSGTANSVSATLSGVGVLQSCTLQAGTVSLDLSGAGNAVIAATDSLSVNISGVGNASYLGDPQVSEDVSGVGSITQISDCSEAE